MKRAITLTSVLLALVGYSACGGKGDATSIQQTNSNAAIESGELRFKTPDGWVAEKASSTMRVAQYKLPKADGDNEDASLVVYYFGATQGGSVQANIDRWISQMEQADGSAAKDKAKTETMVVNGLKVTTVDVTGTYTAEMAPGSGTFHNNSNYRLRAAVVETPRGNYFAKLVGPEKTITRWNQSFVDYLKSFEFK